VNAKSSARKKYLFTCPSWTLLDLLFILFSAEAREAGKGAARSSDYPLKR
jgi:hypothetical protein